MREQEYSVDDLIRYLEPIPDDLWCVGRLQDDNGRHCALGHCGGTPCDYGTNHTPMSAALNDLVCDAVGFGIIPINDGRSDIPETLLADPTPKGRVLAALRFIKAKQSKQLPTPPALVLAPAAWPMVAMQVKPVEEVGV